MCVWVQGQEEKAVDGFRMQAKGLGLRAWAKGFLKYN